LVAPERVQTLRLILWERSFHRINAQPATTSRARDANDES
jgi:hypothetical protein